MRGDGGYLLRGVRRGVGSGSGDSRGVLVSVAGQDAFACLAGRVCVCAGGAACAPLFSVSSLFHSRPPAGGMRRGVPTAAGGRRGPAAVHPGNTGAGPPLRWGDLSGRVLSAWEPGHKSASGSALWPGPFHPLPVLSLGFPEGELRWGGAAEGPLQGGVSLSLGGCGRKKNSFGAPPC